MALQHELRVAGSGVPELHAAVLRAGEDPVSIRCEGNREDEVLHMLVQHTHKPPRVYIPCVLRRS